MVRVTLTVRPLTADDAERSQQLGFEAFGVPEPLPSEPATLGSPGRHTFGVFAGGELVARASDREYDSWFGGVAVPTAGIAGVTVAAEFRGRGALSPLVEAMLRAARERGAALSTLFPTAPRIYRRFGYELVADLVTVSVPSTTLAAVRSSTGTMTRRATEADVPAVREVYDSWAAGQNGPLTRRGVSFPSTPVDDLARFTAITVAEDASGVVGYAAWHRGPGYGEPARLTVEDLVARTPGGYRALLAVLGSFASVTPSTRIKTSGDDLTRLFIPGLDWEVVRRSPYMLKVLDVGRAFSLRRYPPRFSGTLLFRLAGDLLDENDGDYRLQVADGAGRCEPTGSGGSGGSGGSDDRVLTPAGLALLYAGAQSCANLRAAGLLQGGSPDDDPVWDALLGGRQLHIRDYF